MTMIELGDVSGVPAGSPEPAPESEFQQGSVRRLVVIGLVMLCAVLLGGSARPDPAGFRQLWSAPFGQGDTMSIRGDVVYVHRDTHDGARLTAYRAETGGKAMTFPPLSGPTPGRPPGRRARRRCTDP